MVITKEMEQEEKQLMEKGERKEKEMMEKVSDLYLKNFYTGIWTFSRKILRFGVVHETLDTQRLIYYQPVKHWYKK